MLGVQLGPRDRNEGKILMAFDLLLIFGCGLLALGYGIYASRAVLAADAGNDRMREISDAIREGASAYLNRQYQTIAVVGVVIGIFLWWRMGLHVAVGYSIGAILSAATGFIVMNLSVRANVRPAAAARTM